MNYMRMIISHSLTVNSRFILLHAIFLEQVLHCLTIRKLAADELHNLDFVLTEAKIIRSYKP